MSLASSSQSAGMTLGTTHAGFSITGGAANTFATANTFNFLINGKSGTFASGAGQATPTTDINTAAAFLAIPKNYGSVFVFGVNAAGTIQAAQSPGNLSTPGYVALDASGAFLLEPPFPALPDNFVPFGYLVIKNGSTGSNFTFGTTNWNATGITATAVSIGAMPDRPQIA